MKTTNVITYNELMEDVNKNCKWVVYSSQTNKIYYLNDKKFQELLKENSVVLSGKFIKFGHLKQKIWVDAIIKKGEN